MQIRLNIYFLFFKLFYFLQVKSVMLSSNITIKQLLIILQIKNFIYSKLAYGTGNFKINNKFNVSFVICKL